MPVTAFVEDIAASGGYWLAAAADKIYVQPSSLIGSIGVIASSFGFEDFIKEHKVHRRVYTAGRSKSMLDPFLPEKKEDVERIRQLQEEIHAQFIAWVKERRGSRLKGSDAELFEGQIWTGAGAIGTGLVDAVGDLRGVYHEKYGEHVRLMEFVPEKPFFQSLMGVKAQKVDLAEQVLATIENRAEWSRFGL
jgi:ClpP class serine protease